MMDVLKLLKKHLNDNYNIENYDQTDGSIYLEKINCDKSFNKDNDFFCYSIDIGNIKSPFSISPALYFSPCHTNNFSELEIGKLFKNFEPIKNEILDSFTCSLSSFIKKATQKESFTIKYPDLNNKEWIKTFRNEQLKPIKGFNIMRTFLLCDESVYEEIELKLFFDFRNSIVVDTIYFIFNNFHNPSGLNFNDFDGKRHTYEKIDNFHFDDSFFLQKINNSFKSILASSGIDEFTLENFNDNILMLEMVFV